MTASEGDFSGRIPRPGDLPRVGAVFFQHWSDGWQAYRVTRVWLYEGRDIVEGSHIDGRGSIRTPWGYPWDQRHGWLS